MFWNLKNELPVKLAVIHITGISVTFEQGPFNKLLECAREYYKKYKETNLGEIPGIQIARKFFREIGLDPTKKRPSSEALLNRAVKGKEFYTINSLVDTGNWCSLDFLLPVCIYDADKIQGQVLLRKGNVGEFYQGLNNNPIHLNGRYCLADESGPFGSPITDSTRTAADVRTITTNMVLFTPADYTHEKLRQQSEIFAQRISKYCGGDRIEYEFSS